LNKQLGSSLVELFFKFVSTLTKNLQVHYLLVSKHKGIFSLTIAAWQTESLVWVFAVFFNGFYPKKPGKFLCI